MMGGGPVEADPHAFLSLPQIAFILFLVEKRS